MSTGAGGQLAGRGRLAVSRPASVCLEGPAPGAAEGSIDPGTGHAHEDPTSGCRIWPLTSAAEPYCGCGLSGHGLGGHGLGGHGLGGGGLGGGGSGLAGGGRGQEGRWCVLGLTAAGSWCVGGWRGQSGGGRGQSGGERGQSGSGRGQSGSGHGQGWHEPVSVWSAQPGRSEQEGSGHAPPRLGGGALACFVGVVCEGGCVCLPGAGRVEYGAPRRGLAASPTHGGGRGGRRKRGGGEGEGGRGGGGGG